MTKIVRHAYVSIDKPSRREMDWPNTVVTLYPGLPYEGDVVDGPGIKGRFTIPEDEECPFKYGDLVKVTIELDRV